MRAAGWRPLQYVNAGRSGAYVYDSVPGVPGTGIDHLIPTSAKTLGEAVAAVLMNWGANDYQLWPLNPVEWVSDYMEIINYCHALWPTAVIYISYPWRADYDAEFATMYGYVDTVIATAVAAGIDCRPAVDEGVTIKDGDGGYLETDLSEGGVGVHYSDPYGVGLYAATMQAVLGY